MVLQKKRHKIKISLLISKKWNKVEYGFYGLKSTTGGVLTAKQLEASRRVISRETKRVGKIFIRVFFSLPITKKPLLSRMGKGCGQVKSWVVVVKKGTVILEINGVNDTRLAKNALKTASLRLPIKVVTVARDIICLSSSNW